jgi:hypothetical protein
MDEAAAPQAAGIVDWDELARVTGAVTLDLVREAFQSWLVDEAGGLCWAVKPGEVNWWPTDTLIRSAVIAGSPVGLADQLDVQARLRGFPSDELAALNRAVFGTTG